MWPSVQYYLINVLMCNIIFLRLVNISCLLILGGGQCLLLHLFHLYYWQLEWHSLLKVHDGFIRFRCWQCLDHTLDLCLFLGSYHELCGKYAKWGMFLLKQGRISEAEVSIKRLYGKERVAEVMSDLDAASQGSSEPEAGWFDLFSSRYSKGIYFLQEFL